MTIRTFWRILIKVAGVYLIVDSITVVPGAVGSYLYTYSLQIPDAFYTTVVGLTAISITLLFYFLLLRYCVFRPEWLIDKLDLDKGFSEETINLDINKSRLLSIVAIVIGALVFLDSFPMFCKEIFSYYQEESISGRFGDSPSTRWVILYGVQSFLGYLVIVNHRFVVDLIDKTAPGILEEKKQDDETANKS